MTPTERDSLAVYGKAYVVGLRKAKAFQGAQIHMATFAEGYATAVAEREGLLQACKWFVEMLTECRIVWVPGTAASVTEFVTKLNAANAAILKAEEGR